MQRKPTGHKGRPAKKGREAMVLKGRRGVNTLRVVHQGDGHAQGGQMQKEKRFSEEPGEAHLSHHEERPKKI